MVPVIKASDLLLNFYIIINQQKLHVHVLWEIFGNIGNLRNPNAK